MFVISGFAVPVPNLRALAAPAPGTSDGSKPRDTDIMPAVYTRGIQYAISSRKADRHRFKQST